MTLDVTPYPSCPLYMVKLMVVHVANQKCTYAWFTYTCLLITILLKYA